MASVRVDAKDADPKMLAIGSRLLIGVASLLQYGLFHFLNFR